MRLCDHHFGNVLAALQLACLLLAAPTWAKERPELTLGIAGRHMGLMGVYEPLLTWTHFGRVLGCEYAAGVDVTATNDEKIADYSVFGRIKRSFYGWNFKARLDTASDHLQSVDTYFHMEGGPTNTLLRVRGNVARDFSGARVTDIGLEQPVDWRGMTADVSTNYDFDRKKADLEVVYRVRNGSLVTLGVDSEKNQQLSVCQQIGERHELTPTMSSKGDMELEYKYNADRLGAMTTIYNPKRALTLKYERGMWMSDLTVPLRDFYKPQQGTRFSVRRSLESFA